MACRHGPGSSPRPFGRRIAPPVRIGAFRAACRWLPVGNRVRRVVRPAGPWETPRRGRPRRSRRRPRRLACGLVPVASPQRVRNAGCAIGEADCDPVVASPLPHRLPFVPGLGLGHGRIQGPRFGALLCPPGGVSVGDVQKQRVQRRGGRWTSRVACALLGACPGVGLHRGARRGRAIESALAAAPGKQPLPGHQSRVPPGATLVGPAPSRHDVAARGHAPSSRSRRLGGRGAGGLRPALLGVPPLPDAGTVRAALRGGAGHHRIRSRRRSATTGSRSGRRRRPGCPCPSRAPWRRSSPPSRPRSSATAWLRARPGTTTRRPRRCRSRWRRRSKESSD